MLPFSVILRPGFPPYEEIVYSVKKAIATGRLTAGTRFPSVRAMSRELKLNPNTCQKAVMPIWAISGWIPVFIFAWVMLNESLGSLEATSRSDDAPTKDDRDTFGRRLGDSFYGYTVNDVTVLSEMGSDAERSGLFRDTL